MLDVHTSLFVLRFLAFALSLFVSTYGLGALFLKLPSQSHLGRLFYRCVLGTAIWSYFIFALGVSSCLFKELILVFFVCSIILACRTCLHESLRPNFTPYSEIPFWLALAALASASFLLALYPAHTWDDTSFHLAVASIYTKAHALVLTKYVRFPVFNEFTEMLFCASYPFIHDIGAQLICWFCNVLITIGIYSFLRDRISISAAFFGTAVWCSSGLAFRLSSIAFIDIPLTLFCTATSISWLEAFSRKNFDAKYIILAGVFAGCAISAKYTALVLFTGVITWALIYLFLQKTCRKSLPWILALYTTPAIMLSSVWFIRNYYFSNNPVFPYLSSIFGKGNLYTNWDYTFLNITLKSYPKFNMDIAGFLACLWNLSFPKIAHNELTCSFTIFFWFGTLACLFCYPLSNQKKYLSFLLFNSLFFIVPWFFTAQNSRYLLPILPLVAIYTGIALADLGERSKALKGASLKSDHAIESFILGSVVSFVPIYDYFNTASGYGPIPINTSQRGAFLRKMLPTYPAYEFLNGLAPGNLYSFSDENMCLFYEKGLFLGDIFGPVGYVWIAQYAVSAEALRAYMKSLDVTYFLVHKSKNSWPLKLPSSEFFRLHFIPIYQNADCTVYRID